VLIYFIIADGHIEFVLDGIMFFIDNIYILIIYNNDTSDKM